MVRPNKDVRTKADELVAKGKYKKALSIYLKLDDHSAAGEMFEKLGQIEMAVEQYANAGEFIRCGDLLCSIDKNKEAAQMFEKGGEFERGAELMAAQRDYELAAKMFEKGELYTEAGKMFEEAGNQEAAANLYHQGGNHAAAIRLYLGIDKKEMAARLLSETGDHIQAAKIYDEMGLYGEAASSYVIGGMKHDAVKTHERAGEIDKAAALCAELGLHAEAAKYNESLGNRKLAVELFAKAGRFAEAGRILEADHLIYEAGKMFEQDDSTVVHAAELFRSTHSMETVWQSVTKLPVSGLATTPTGNRTAVTLAGPEAMLFDDEGNLLWRFRIPMGVRARSVAMTSDASWIAIGTKDRSVYLLDSSKKLIWKREFEGEVRGVGFDEAEKVVIAGCTDNRVKALTAEGKDLWTAETGHKVWHLACHQETGSILVGCGDMNLYMFDFAGKLKWKESEDDWVSRVAISRDGKHAAAILGMKKLSLYDLEKNAMLWQYEHDDVLQDVAFLDDEQLILGSNTEAFVLGFDKTVTWRHVAGDAVMKVAAAGDGSHVCMGHYSKGLTAIRLHDCNLRAARNFERGGVFGEAAAIFEQKNELSRAIDLYERVEDFDLAARLAEKLEEVERAGEFYEKAGKFDEAAACFEKLNLVERAANCYSAAGHKSRAGNLLARMGNAVRAAELHMESGDLLAAGIMFEKAGATDQALSAYEQAREADKLTGEGAVRLGALYMTSERFDDAIKLLQPVTQDKDFATRALSLLGKCFMNKGMHSLSAECYQEALGGQDTIRANNIDLFYELGCAHEQAGSYEKVRDIFRRILAVDYYYKDVTGRLEHINEMSRIFSSTPGTGATEGAGSYAPGAATMPPARQTRYEIIRKLGEGGMGVVYLARDTKLDRVVAWKVLPSRLSGNDELRTRFVREARAIAALNHKNIVSVYDIGEERGESFISMEFIEGSSLREMLRANKTLGIIDTIELAKQIADGLSAAHQAGIIHRDVKPENVMVITASGDVKVMDFGLARIGKDSDITGEGAILGTWRYMAPEQVMGERSGPPADVYAVGIMIFEMITGSPPFTEGDFAYQHVNTTPPRLGDIVPDVPDGLSAIVKRCLEKNADDRYADGAELRRALDLSDSTINATVVG